MLPVAAVVAAAVAVAASRKYRAQHIHDGLHMLHTSLMSAE